MDRLSTTSNSVIHEDIQKVSILPLLDRLKPNSTILVTGATGLIGASIIKSLICFNRGKLRNLHIIALVRSISKAQAVLTGFLDDGDIELLLGDVTQPIVYSGKIDYIIHGASATSSKYFVEHPTQTICTAIEGTRNILELARQKKVQKVVYLSSLEVYGIPDPHKAFISETDYGYIDPLQVRSSYSEGKRMAECLCAAYAKEYGVPVTVARLAQTFGAGVAYDDGRVFAEFARCAIEKRDIVLHTQGNTTRSYCYITDAISAIFTLMLYGHPGEAYNIANMQTLISIRDMAQLVCDLFPESGMRVRFDIPEDIAQYGYNPEMIIQLDTRKLSLLGWKAEVHLPSMFMRLIESMKIDMQIKNRKTHSNSSFIQRNINP